MNATGTAVNDPAALCGDCNAPLANHVCPLNAGTVRAVAVQTTTPQGTVVKLQRQKSVLPDCQYCNLPHTAQRGVDLVCLWLEAANELKATNSLGTDGEQPYNAAIWQQVLRNLNNAATNNADMGAWWRNRRAGTGKPLAPPKVKAPAPLKAPPKAKAPKAEATPEVASATPQATPAADAPATAADGAPPKQTDRQKAAKAADAVRKLNAAKRRAR